MSWQKTVLTFNEYLDLHGIAYGREDYPDHEHATFMTVLPDLQAQAKQSHEDGVKEVVEVVNNLPSFGGGGGYNFAGIGKEWEAKLKEWGLTS